MAAAYDSDVRRMVVGPRVVAWNVAVQRVDGVTSSQSTLVCSSQEPQYLRLDLERNGPQ
jgi:hypothetical protein